MDSNLHEPSHDADREFDCHYRDEPICPFCGHVVGDAWELELDDEQSTEVECDECEREFTVTASVSVDYSTKPTTICALTLRFTVGAFGVCRCGFEIEGERGAKVREKWEEHRDAMATVTALLVVWGRYGSLPDKREVGR